MMTSVRLFALLWLVFLGALVLGMQATKHDLWPYRVFSELMRFLQGDEEETTTLKEKVQNDLGLRPSRHLVKAPPPAKHLDARYKTLDALPLGSRQVPPKMYLAKDAPRGYRLIYGVFDLDTHLHAALLLDPEGNIERLWKISQEGVDWNHQADANVFPHGMDITPHGDLIVAFDHGTSLTRYDWCGNEVWRLMGGYHHSVTLTGKGSLWTWGNDGKPSQFGNIAHEIRVADGAILRSISISQMIEANRDIDIFGIRQRDESNGSTWLFTGGGPFHHNDVDPLPERLADYYPRFEAGDLLISMRSPNLVFVLDPANLKVKWWRQGLTRRQHDPDWNARGTFTIFNNNMHIGWSNIVELDPRTLQSKILLDGTEYRFYSWHRGKHQQLPTGHLLVTSAAQGRAFEVAPDGDVTFDFYNLYGEDNLALALSEARFIPLDYFDERPQCD